MTPNAPSIVLFEGQGSRIVYQPANSPFLVFSFNGMGFAQVGNHFFGDGFFANRGIAAVGIVDARSLWFRSAELAAAIATLGAHPLLQTGQRRISYGVSMGAYGALKYGAALGAHAAIAVAPQATIETEAIGAWDKRYAALYRSDLHRGMGLRGDDLAPHNFAFYDTAVPEDRRHAALLPPTPSTHRVVSPFIGHPGIVFFTQTRLVERILALASRDRPEPFEMRRLVRDGRPRSAAYWFNRAERLRSRRTDRLQAALDAFRRAYELNRFAAGHPDTIRIGVGYATALLAAGHKASSLSLVDTLWDVYQRGFAVPGLRDLLRAVGDTARLRRFAEASRGTGGMRPELLVGQAKQLYLAGKIAEAGASADAARDVAGESLDAWRRLSWLYQRLGRDDGVAAAEVALARLECPAVSLRLGAPMPAPAAAWAGA